jgi:hypothetical protein
MDNIYKIMLGLHIVSGFLALLCGGVSLVVKKGGTLHRNSGKIFFYSMLGVSSTAIFISIVKNNQFLLLIGIFAFYLNYAGFRAVQNKSLNPSSLDWLMLAIAVANSFFMVYSLNMILMIFGGIGFYAAIQNLRTNIMLLKKKKLPELAWLKMHIGMMMGAYISTATAFLVVNMNSFDFMNLPYWFIWLLPSFVLLPFSMYYTKKYTTK